MLRMYKKMRLKSKHFAILMLALFLFLKYTTIYRKYDLCSENANIDPVVRSSDLLKTFVKRYNERRNYGAGLSRRLPHCIIIGVGKCGTRALLTYLGLHPDVVTAKNETEFFSLNYAKGGAYYLDEMPLSREDQLTIEKTPRYFSLPYVPERIKAMNASIKLMVIVKEPVSRAVSSYLQRDYKYQSSKTFEEYAIMPNGEVNSTYKGIVGSRYHERMDMWLNHFPRRQIHVVDGDALIKNPASEIYKVEQFLGIRHNITEDNFYYSKEKGYFCWRDWRGRDTCLGESKGRAHPPVDPAVWQKLKDYFEPHNKQFNDLVGVDFRWNIS